MPTEIRVLVIGCGSIGRRHIGNLLELGVRDILATDTRNERMNEVKSKFGVQTVAGLEEALDCQPNVAIIATPTSSHLALALKAAHHGCHLFIEKPLSHNAEDVDRLIQLVREKGLITLVGCNMRFHPSIRKIKELLQESVIGHIVAALVEAGQYLPDWHPWEDYRQMYSARRDSGGGVILDSIHEIDYIRWMLGDVKDVACFAGRLSRLEIETEDTAAILLYFANGTIGEIHLDYIQRTYNRTCQIIGEEGTIHWNCNEKQVRWYSAKTCRWQYATEPDGWEQNQMYLDEMTHFLRCLKGEEDSVLDITEAKNVLEVALAAKRASQTRTIVRIKK